MMNSINSEITTPQSKPYQANGTQTGESGLVTKANTNVNAEISELTESNPVPQISHKRLMKLVQEYSQLRDESGDWSRHTIEAVTKCADWFKGDWEIIQAATKVATIPQIKDYLRMLKIAGNYFDKPMTDDETRILASVWIASVQKVKMPADILGLACQRWLLSPEKCFPSPGRLFEKVAGVHGARQILVNRVGNAIKYLDGEAT